MDGCGGEAGGEMAAVEVGPIWMKVGQMMRNSVWVISPPPPRRRSRGGEWCKEREKEGKKESKEDDAMIYKQSK